MEDENRNNKKEKVRTVGGLRALSEGACWDGACDRVRDLVDCDGLSTAMLIESCGDATLEGPTVEAGSATPAAPLEGEVGRPFVAPLRGVAVLD